MEHLSLEYFVEIAKQRNISKAAENLHMSQQSLSAYIQKLEKYYGVQLLIRKPKMRLTEAVSGFCWQQSRLMKFILIWKKI